MGAAALTIALSLALLFTLLSVLLADLLCSLLCCRKHRFQTAAPHTSDAAAVLAAAAAEEEEDDHPPTPPALSSFPAFYAHGVLQAPTTFLLTIPMLEAAAAAAAVLPPKQVECKSGRMPLTAAENESPSVPASPSIHRISSASISSAAAPDHFVCISNPIYDGRIGGGDHDVGTPFETPEYASPSHLGLDQEEETDQSDYSPQLTAMKKLPSVAPGQAFSAVALMEGRPTSLATSVSATETNRASSSSSSSLYSQLCCSPSW